ncbi:D-alanyl-D-alanine carboxypeptidase family protein [Allostreptomyces psammosilenae]|uniref:D-alanyl-D-alanine carboxypeptidase n=1 Tax=Allostreptomyces psammosilenae TaxID=1892865 RepID=A0A853A2R4_9ACTN|nr:D-alanyl-D-alanine carboxypeptidase [Allostreptomyces psammosilenae]NYI07760.1 D-alanyl-D-alanine carboxypeptidase [Allostreptomyces psammosilenae]
MTESIDTTAGGDENPPGEPDPAPVEGRGDPDEPSNGPAPGTRGPAEPEDAPRKGGNGNAAEAEPDDEDDEDGGAGEDRADAGRHVVGEEGVDVDTTTVLRAPAWNLRPSIDAEDDEHNLHDRKEKEKAEDFTSQKPPRQENGADGGTDAPLPPAAAPRSAGDADGTPNAGASATATRDGDTPDTRTPDNHTPDNHTPDNRTMAFGVAQLRRAATPPTPSTPPDAAGAAGAAGNGDPGTRPLPVAMPPGATPSVVPPAPPAHTLRAGASGQVPASVPPAPVIGPDGQPLPPMQLLAALTNKPPTRLQLVMRRVRIWGTLAVLLFGLLAIAQMIRPLPDPTVRSVLAATVAFEGETPQLPWPSEGQAAVEVVGLGSLGSSGGDEPRPIASITKVMTAYILLRDHPLGPDEAGPTITVDAEEAASYEARVAEGQSAIRVVEGQEFTQRTALEALLIPSANNIAALLARWDAGSEEAFVDKMNATAAELGMTNSTFTDPSGLDPETVSTASDLIRLAQAAMQDPTFREIVATPQLDLPHNPRLYNNNALLTRDGVIGIKTGSTTSAGGCLLFAAEKEVGGTTQLIVGAVLGQFDGTSILDTALERSRELIVAAGDALTAQTVAEQGEVVAEVDDGLGNTTPLVATADVTAVGWPGLTVRVDARAGAPEAEDAEQAAGEAEADGPDASGTVPHEAPAGEPLATLTTGEGAGVTSVPLALQEDLTEPGFWDRLTRIL